MFAVNIVVHVSFENNNNNKSQGLNNHFGLTLRGLNLMWQKVDLTKIIHLTADRTEHQKIHKIPVFQVFFPSFSMFNLTSCIIMFCIYCMPVNSKKFRQKVTYKVPLWATNKTTTTFETWEFESTLSHSHSCGEIIHHVTLHHPISQIRCFFKSLLLICTAYRVHHFLLSSLQQKFVNHYLYREIFFIPSGVRESSYQKHQMCFRNVSSGQI